MARQIIVQQEKTPDILEAEYNDLELIRSVKKNKPGKNKSKKINDNQSNKIKFTDTLVVKNEIIQPVSENFSDKKVVFDVLKSNGAIVEVETTVKYSSKNKRYYIRKSQYKNIKEKGIILCRIVQESGASGGWGFAGGKLKQESKLHEYGYNVSQKEGLTEKQREVILDKVLENNVYKAGELIHLIEFFVSCNINSIKKDMQKAIHKWEHDIDYVKGKLKLK